MNIAIILASGNGERIKSSEKKCFIEVCNKPLFSFSLDVFLSVDEIDYVYLVIPEGYIDKVQPYLSHKVRFVYGGLTRSQSVSKGLNAIKCDFINENPFILVHDGARPLIDKNIILEHLKTKDIYDASLTAISSYDSLIKIENRQYVKNIDRNKVHLEQTPTCAYLNTFIFAFTNHQEATDDASLLSKAGFNIKYVDGNRRNFKITDDVDLEIFTSIMK